jgi:hypothetical protein
MLPRAQSRRNLSSSFDLYRVPLPIGKGQQIDLLAVSLCHRRNHGGIQPAAGKDDRPLTPVLVHSSNSASRSMPTPHEGVPHVRHNGMEQCVDEVVCG